MTKQALFRNDLYTVTEIKTESSLKFSAEIKLNLSHKIFDGHFPENPILPGVCNIQIIKELLSQFTGKNAKLAQAVNIKYSTFIDPRRNPDIVYDFTLSESGPDIMNCNVSVNYSDVTFCSFRGEFRIT
jgi:3-hydroxyacyl-[acyl-carrier-protein] dehydratase